jgi:GTP-binding protein Era
MNDTPDQTEDQPEDQTESGAPHDPQQTRCGFVAIIGAPNAGKSTLLNALMGMKVSIVSPKVQTTRMRVRGIMMRGASQIILVDTPGIFKPRRRLDRAMVAAAWDGEQDADIIALIVDASRSDAEGTHRRQRKEMYFDPEQGRSDPPRYFTADDQGF